MTKEQRLAKVSESKQKKFAESIKHVDLEELRRLYIEENQTYEFIRQYYNLTGYTLDKILRENNIKKPRKQSASLVLQTKYNKAGSKQAYDAQVYQTTCKNIEAKGITLQEHYASVGKKCKDAWHSKTQEEQERLLLAIRENYLDIPEKVEAAKQVRIETNISKYGVDNTYKLSEYTAGSTVNKMFAQMLAEKGIQFEEEKFLHTYDKNNYSGFRYDFLVGTTLVEINPWPFHNTTWSPINTQAPLHKDYHSKKTQTAILHGYRCIHVWDWDSYQKIVDSLCSKQILYARQLEVKLVKKEACKEFLNKYHLQGTCLHQDIRIGLFLQDKLIQIMTFGKPRYNKNYEYELLRLCTHPEYAVVGGAEKLFKYFVKNYSPESIISYCDNSKFSGKVYSRLGMILLSYGEPTRHWYNTKTRKHVTDNLLRQRGFDQLFGAEYGCYGKGTSNHELMLKHNFVEVFDCGQSTYIWKNT